MTTPSEIRVSVDVGCHRHSVAVGLPSGQVLDEFEVEHRPEGFHQFFARIERLQQHHGGAVSVAMEGYNGWARPLDTLVRSRGYRLFNINNLKLARFKEIFPAAAKTDRIDARKGLELFQLCDHLPVATGVLQEVAATPLANEKLKRLTRRADNVWFLHFLSHRDELSKLARLQESTILGIKGVGRTYAAIITAWQKTARFSHDVAWVGPMSVEDARRVLELRTKIKALEAQCSALMAHSDMAQRIASIPGFGPVCAAEIAGELGTIDRFAKEGSLAVYLGMASLDNSSGKQHGSRPPKHVNTRAKAAMMVGVDRHRKQAPESQRFYEKKRAQGKTHNQAIRALGRHLSRVLFSMLKQGRNYELRQDEK